MPIDREILIKQLQFLEQEIKTKLKEIAEYEETLQATKKLLGTYKTPDAPVRAVNNTNSQVTLPVPKTVYFIDHTEYRRPVTGNKISGSTSVEAMEIVLSKETLSLGQLTDKLIKMGHFVDNINPKSSVHVTLTRRPDLFQKIEDKNGVKWKLR